MAMAITLPLAPLDVITRALSGGVGNLGWVWNESWGGGWGHYHMPKPGEVRRTFPMPWTTSNHTQASFRLERSFWIPPAPRTTRNEYELCEVRMLVDIVSICQADMRKSEQWLSPLLKASQRKGHTQPVSLLPAPSVEEMH